ncbi:hypothetical protein BBJ28_00016800, partial [Nothophytophthora sp. Chile5]
LPAFLLLLLVGDAVLLAITASTFRVVVPDLAGLIYPPSATSHHVAFGDASSLFSSAFEFLAPVSASSSVCTAALLCLELRLSSAFQLDPFVLHRYDSKYPLISSTFDVWNPGEILPVVQGDASSSPSEMTAWQFQTNATSPNPSQDSDGTSSPVIDLLLRLRQRSQWLSPRDQLLVHVHVELEHPQVATTSLETYSVYGNQRVTHSTRRIASNTLQISLTIGRDTEKRDVIPGDAYPPNPAATTGSDSWGSGSDAEPTVCLECSALLYRCSVPEVMQGDCSYATSTAPLVACMRDLHGFDATWFASQETGTSIAIDVAVNDCFDRMLLNEPSIMADSTPQGRPSWWDQLTAVSCLAANECPFGPLEGILNDIESAASSKMLQLDNSTLYTHTFGARVSSSSDTSVGELRFTLSGTLAAADGADPSPPYSVVVSDSISESSSAEDVDAAIVQALPDILGTTFTVSKSADSDPIGDAWSFTITLSNLLFPAFESAFTFSPSMEDSYETHSFSAFSKLNAVPVNTTKLLKPTPNAQCEACADLLDACQQFEPCQTDVLPCLISQLEALADPTPVESSGSGSSGPNAGDIGSQASTGDADTNRVDLLAPLAACVANLPMAAWAPIRQALLCIAHSQCVLGSDVGSEGSPTILRLNDGYQSFVVTPESSSTNVVALTITLRSSDRPNVNSDGIKTFMFNASASVLGKFLRSFVLFQAADVSVWISRDTVDSKALQLDVTYSNALILSTPTFSSTSEPLRWLHDSPTSAFLEYPASASHPALEWLITALRNRTESVSNASEPNFTWKLAEQCVDCSAQLFDCSREAIANQSCDYSSSTAIFSQCLHQQLPSAVFEGLLANDGSSKGSQKRIESEISRCATTGSSTAINAALACFAATRCPFGPVESIQDAQMVVLETSSYIQLLRVSEVVDISIQYRLDGLLFASTEPFSVDSSELEVRKRVNDALGSAGVEASVRTSHSEAAGAEWTLEILYHHVFLPNEFTVDAIVVGTSIGSESMTQIVMKSSPQLRTVPRTNSTVTQLFDSEPKSNPTTLAEGDVCLQCAAVMTRCQNDPKCVKSSREVLMPWLRTATLSSTTKPWSPVNQLRFDTELAPVLLSMSARTSWNALAAEIYCLADRLCDLGYDAEGHEPTYLDLKRVAVLLNVRTYADTQWEMWLNGTRFTYEADASASLSPLEAAEAFRTWIEAVVSTEPLNLTIQMTESWVVEASGAATGILGLYGSYDGLLGRYVMPPLAGIPWFSASGGSTDSSNGLSRAGVTVTPWRLSLWSVDSAPQYDKLLDLLAFGAGNVSVSSSTVAPTPTPSSPKTLPLTDRCRECESAIARCQNDLDCAASSQDVLVPRLRIATLSPLSTSVYDERGSARVAVSLTPFLNSMALTAFQTREGWNALSAELLCLAVKCDLDYDDGSLATQPSYLSIDEVAVKLSVLTYADTQWSMTIHSSEFSYIPESLPIYEAAVAFRDWIQARVTEDPQNLGFEGGEVKIDEQSGAARIAISLYEPGRSMVAPSLIPSFQVSGENTGDSTELPKAEVNVSLWEISLWTVNHEPQYGKLLDLLDFATLGSDSPSSTSSSGALDTNSSGSLDANSSGSIDTNSSSSGDGGYVCDECRLERQSCYADSDCQTSLIVWVVPTLRSSLASFEFSTSPDLSLTLFDEVLVPNPSADSRQKLIALLNCSGQSTAVKASCLQRSCDLSTPDAVADLEIIPATSEITVAVGGNIIVYSMLGGTRNYVEDGDTAAFSTFLDDLVVEGVHVKTTATLDSDNGLRTYRFEFEGLDNQLPPYFIWSNLSAPLTPIQFQFTASTPDLLTVYNPWLHWLGPYECTECELQLQNCDADSDCRMLLDQFSEQIREHVWDRSQQYSFDIMSIIGQIFDVDSNPSTLVSRQKLLELFNCSSQDNPTGSCIQKSCDQGMAGVTASLEIVPALSIFTVRGGGQMSIANDFATGVYYVDDGDTTALASFVEEHVLGGFAASGVHVEATASLNADTNQRTYQLTYNGLTSSTTPHFQWEAPDDGELQDSLDLTIELRFSMSASDSFMVLNPWLQWLNSAAIPGGYECTECATQLQTCYDDEECQYALTWQALPYLQLMGTYAESVNDEFVFDATSILLGAVFATLSSEAQEKLLAVFTCSVEGAASCIQRSCNLGVPDSTASLEIEPARATFVIAAGDHMTINFEGKAPGYTDDGDTDALAAFLESNVLTDYPASTLEVSATLASDTGLRSYTFVFYNLTSPSLVLFQWGAATDPDTMYSESSTMQFRFTSSTVDLAAFNPWLAWLNPYSCSECTAQLQSCYDDVYCQSALGAFVSNPSSYISGDLSMASLFSSESSPQSRQKLLDLFACSNGTCIQRSCDMGAPGAVASLEVVPATSTFTMTAGEEMTIQFAEVWGVYYTDDGDTAALSAFIDDHVLGHASEVHVETVATIDSYTGLRTYQFVFRGLMGSIVPHFSWSNTDDPDAQDSSDTSMLFTFTPSMEASMVPSAMSWGGWGAKLTVPSLVSQGLEQVRSLREDVEKSFDQVVAGAALPPRPAAPSAAVAVDDIGVTKPAVWAAGGLNQRLQQPPHSADGKQRPEMLLPLTRSPAEALEVEETTAIGSESEEKAPGRSNEEKEGDTGTVDEGERVEGSVTGDVAVVDAEAAAEEKGVETEAEIDALAEKDDSQEEAEGAEEKQQTGDEEQETEETEAVAREELEGESKVEQVEGTTEAPTLAEEASKAEDEAIETATEDCDADDAAVAALRKELDVREAQLLATSSTIRELHDELDKTCRREVAAVERTQFLTDQLELMRHEVAKLTQLHRESSSSQSADAQALQLALAEKDEKLRALLDEGQALSVKQAQYEQRLRSLRKEKDEQEERALKTQSQYDVAALEVQELSSKVKASEEEMTRLALENRQLLASAEATSAKVERAEKEAREATQQLEKLRLQIEELTLDAKRKGEEVEGLKTATQSNETLSLEKTELQQTLRFLQDSVRDLEQEAAHREEMARSEIADLKRKWQDAVARVDMLGQGVSDATQPLLRQIHAMQEDQRGRQESWKAAESALVLRIEDASERRRAVEQEKLAVDHQLHALQGRMEELELELARKQAELSRAQDAAETAKAEARELRGQAEALQVDLEQAKHQREAEGEARQQLQARLHSVEEALKKARTTAVAPTELEQARERETQLQHDLQWHQQELQRLKEAHSQPAPLSTGSSSASQHRYVRTSFDGEPYTPAGGSSDLSSQASILKTTLETSMSDPLSASGGNASVLGLSQLQQRVRLREGENRMLKQQLEALEARQKQTTDEIVRLSTRNALLESGEAQRAQAQEELAQLQKHQHVLLELFGEKEEQVEELQAEVGELKAFYRKQLDTLATHNEQQQKQQQKQQREQH